ncbi:MAG: PEPxxWA-CTERM sorting domain-containing protein [Parasphingorhabdus sp.]|uniref:PEPxxWA-CTERM sorting domain-containing protein n=1 Tax=Parasphingorhabdus sp. TaxID=2709688 RepID=UPI00329838CD
MKKIIYSAVAATMALTAVPGSAATLLTSAGGYTGPTLDIGSFAGNPFVFSAGPFALPGGITYSASASNSVIGAGSYGLDGNGVVTSDVDIIGTNNGTSIVTLTFDSVVSSFGGMVNYAPDNGDNATIAAFDINDNLIGSFDLTALAPISTPGAVNAFDFRGIDGDGVGIKSFTLSGDFLIIQAGGLAAAVPEPATWAFMIFGFGAIGGALRRTRKANVKVSYA